MDGSVDPARGAVSDLVARLAPIQSQVPRSPFLTIGSRLPGTAYADVVALLEDRAANWQPWDDLLAYARELMTAGPPELAARADQVRFLLWGQAGLLRRPPDGAWHKRTDTLRRSARVALPSLPSTTFDEAVTAMVDRYLRAYGPVSPDQLNLVWSSKNAVCAPTVLSDGRIVARWKTVGAGRRVRLAVTMLPPHRPLAEDAFTPAVAALERVLDLEVREVGVA